MVPSGPRDIRYRNLHPDNSGRDDWSREGAPAKPGQSYPQRYARGRRRGLPRHPAYRRNYRRRTADRQSREDTASGLRVLRVRGRLDPCCAFGKFRGANANVLHLRWFHSVQFHEQPGSQRANLSAGRRSIPHPDSRQGRRICGFFRKNRCGGDRFSLSDPPERHRRHGASLYPRWDFSLWGAHHMALPH